MSKKRVLFLCTGNSARSQMTEGLVNHLLGNRWEAYSAGTAPTGCVHPLAMRAMAELGIDISAQHSKPVDTFRNTDFDLVITVCDDAARNCPVWLGKGKKVHLGLLDPAAATGSEAEAAGGLPPGAGRYLAAHSSLSGEGGERCRDKPLSEN